MYRRRTPWNHDLRRASFINLGLTKKQQEHGKNEGMKKNNPSSSSPKLDCRIKVFQFDMCIAYIWLISVGSWVVKNSLRHFVDVKFRRDKSYFQSGWDWLAPRVHSVGPITL